MTCPNRFPVLVAGRMYYVACTLPPHDRDTPCEGTVRNL